MRSPRKGEEDTEDRDLGHPQLQSRVKHVKHLWYSVLQPRWTEMLVCCLRMQRNEGDFHA